MEWSQEQLLELIEVYKLFPLLWNPQHPNHFDKLKKSDCWKDIAERMSRPEEECKKKIMSLLSSYRREKGKIKNSSGTGKATSEVYFSHWFAFEALKFLEDRDKPRKRIDTVSEDDPPIQEPRRTEPGGQEASDFESPPTRPSAKRRKSEQQADNNLLESALTLFKETSDKLNPPAEHCEVRHFCDFLRTKMLSYSPITRQGVQHTIYETLIKADQGFFEQSYRPPQPPQLHAPPFTTYGHYPTAKCQTDVSTQPKAQTSQIYQPHLTISPQNTDVPSQRAGDIHISHYSSALSPSASSQLSESDSILDLV